MKSFVLSAKISRLLLDVLKEERARDLRRYVLLESSLPEKLPEKLISNATIFRNNLIIVLSNYAISSIAVFAVRNVRFIHVDFISYILVVFQIREV